MSRRLRVLLVSEATRSGAGRSLWLLAKGLRQAGCEVELACSLLRDGHSVRLFRQLEDDGIRVHHVPMARRVHPWRDLRAVWQLWRLLRRGRYQIVHTHAAKGGWLGRLAARLAGVGVVCHTPHRYVWLNETHPRWLRWSSQRLERWLAALTDATIHVSPAQAAEATRRRILRKQRSVVIPNAIDIAHFRANPSSRAERRLALGLAQETVLIGTVGTLEPGKGYADLFRAFASLRHDGLPVKLLMVGDGPLRCPLERLARQLGIQGDVWWTGYQEDVAPWLSAMDLFVLSSLWEGMPLALLEAMATGIPVVATRVHGAVDLIRPHRTGLLVERRSPEHLALAMRYLIERPAEAALMASQAQQEVSDRHRLEDQARATLRLYRWCRHRWTMLRARRYQRFKRAMDLVGALLIGVAGLPVMFLLTGLIRATSPGPTVIRQRRVGRRHRPFLMYKFRTMTDDPSPRVTRLGAWLRRSGLDELPQLLNVLRGEMSLVGPRPHLPEVVASYARHPSARRRLTVPGGITGWAQVCGRDWSDGDRLTLDAEYLQRRSLRLDACLLLITVPTLLGWRPGRPRQTRPLPLPTVPATLHHMTPPLTERQRRKWLAECDPALLDEGGESDVQKGGV